MEESRYERHLLLDGFGRDGQDKLSKAKVLIVGVGGLGSPVAMYLAAAGIGKLGLIDADVVDVTNLQRQIIHNESSVGMDKVESARLRISELNSETEVETYNFFFDKENAEEIAKDYDFVVDCADNNPTKFLINDVCVKLQKPFCHGSITEFSGRVFTHLPSTACYRCLFDENNEPPAKRGVLGSSVGIIGSIQATEVIKYFTGVGELLTNSLLTLDVKTMSFMRFKMKPSSK
ncbi:MAG: HesA/MoeB/ThiF family protein, partial [Bacteroidales bacterium]|nr:HesA/MoeB/ThiF family protein [Candidatus Scybalocola fimicaballi]